MQIRSIFLALILLSLSPLPALAKKQGIVAIVGDEVITSNELYERVKLAHVTSGSPELNSVDKMSKETLQNLIEEKVKIIRADEINLSASQAEVTEAVTLLEKQNGLPEGGLKIAMRQAGIDYSYLEDRVKAEVIWNKLLQREINNTVTLDDSELDQFIDNGELEKNKYDISEIIIPYRDSSEVISAKKTAEGLLARIQGGESFSQIAKKHSRGPSAISGGRIGWIIPARLPDNVKKAVEESKKDDVKLILTPDSYVIVKVHNIIETDPTEFFSEWHIKSLQIKNPDLKTKQGIGRLNNQIKTIVESQVSCNNVQSISNKISANYKDYGYKKLTDLSGALRNIIPMLAIGELSQPVKGADSINFYLACDKEEISYKEQYEMKKKMASKILRSKKVEEASEKLIQDLRDKTNIEVRI